jgi:outer membrane protein
MKKLFKVALVAAACIFAGNIASAQTKLGYINSDAVLTQMPEAKTIKTQIDAYSKQFNDQYIVMNNELQTKGKEFQAQSATMTDAIRASKQTELQDLQKRIQDFGTNAQQQVEAKTNELVKPLSDKIRAAVNAVAKEKGYAYVLDSGTTALIVSPPGDDLTPDVKAKLGIK